MNTEFVRDQSIVPVNRSFSVLTVMNQVAYIAVTLPLPPPEFCFFVPLALILVYPTLAQPSLYFALLISV
jgi:hypothetical protein